MNHSFLFFKGKNSTGSLCWVREIKQGNWTGLFKFLPEQQPHLSPYPTQQKPGSNFLVHWEEPRLPIVISPLLRGSTFRFGGLWAGHFVFEVPTLIFLNFFFVL
jgi:hypothetical protein